MRRSWSATLSCVGILTVAVGLGVASAQGAAQPAGDQDFVSRAALFNMAAIQLGHMATKQAQRADVKEFAQTTIEDHLKAQKQLADAASGAGVRWPTKLDDKYRQIEQRLAKLGNDQFDREYMKAMIDRDRDVEKMLAARGSSSGETDTLAAKVNQWAAATLPEVRAHLKEAEQVLAQIGKGE
jgi:putative membrane protein